MNRLLRWFRPESPPPDPLAGLSDFRRKSVEVATALPSEVYQSLKAACDRAAQYRTRRKPRPGSPEEVVLRRHTEQAAGILTAAGVDRAQADDIVAMLVDGSE